MNVEQELVQNVQKMDQFLSNEVQGLQIVEQELENEIQRVESAIEEGQQLLRLEGDEIKKLKDALDDIRQIENDIKKTEKLAGEDNSSFLGSNDESSEVNYFRKLEKDELQQLKEAMVDITAIEDELPKEENFAEDEMTKFVEAIEELKMAVQASKKVKHSLETAERMESALLTIAQNNNWSDLQRAIQKEDRDLKTAEQLLETINNEEQKIESLLERTKQEIDEEIEMELEEIKEIKQEINELSKIVNEMKSHIEKIAEQEIQKLDKIGGGQAEYGQKEMKQIANNILSMINEIEKEEMALEKHLEKILELKESEVTVEKKIDEAETQELKGLGDFVGQN